MPDFTETVGHEALTNQKKASAVEKPILETEITRHITRWLNSLPNCFYFKVFGSGYQDSGGRQKPGIPDLYACIKGWSVWIEVKRPGNKPSPIQVKVIKELTQAGADVLVVHSLAELKEAVFKKFGEPEEIAGLED